MPEDADLVTTAQAAEITGKHVATINRWVKRQLLEPVFTQPHPRDKGMRLYRRADVLAVASGQEVTA